MSFGVAGIIEQYIEMTTSAMNRDLRHVSISRDLAEPNGNRAP